MRSLARAQPDRLVLFLAWAVLALSALLLRPLWPVDETRYVAVAWEMWQRGDFLVPYLHGEPYSHKPPLLFWLMHAGWAVFGVNEWWPRLLSPLLALFSAWLMTRLARRLWPEKTDIASSALWIYAGSLLFGVLFTLVGFDFLLSINVLIGMLGLVRAAHGELGRGMLWLGLGIALGILSKGPVVLLHVLPAAVLAPWWAPQWRIQKLRWYGALLGAVLMGAGLALLWAVPAAYVGGVEYRHAIFWGQTAGRMTESFAHRAPFWWYLPLLPLLLFPWLWWGRVWRGCLRLRCEYDTAQRFLIAWVLPVLIGFSLVSGKQERYLLPLLPGFALWIALAVSHTVKQGYVERRWDSWLPAMGVGLLATVLLLASLAPQRLHLPPTISALPQWPAWLLALLALSMVWIWRLEWRAQVKMLSLSNWVLLLILMLGIVPKFVPYSDPRPVAQQLADLQRQGVAFAYWGKYHGEFNFYGRLRPMSSLSEPGHVTDWLRRQPQGRIVYFGVLRVADMQPEWEHPLRNGYLQIWRGVDFATLLARGVIP